MSELQMPFGWYDMIKVLDRDTLEAIIEHDYHAQAFSCNSFLDALSKATATAKRVHEQKMQLGKMCAEYVIGRMNYCNKNWLRDWKTIPRGLMKLSESMTNSTDDHDSSIIFGFQSMCDLLEENSDEECEKIIKAIIGEKQKIIKAIIGEKHE